MAKGFKDSSGKFHPTGNNGTSSKRKSIQPDGSRIKSIQHKVWKFDDAPDDVQEKILERLRQEKSEFGDTFFSEDQGLIFDDNEKKEATDIGLNTPFPEFFDVDSNRGTDFVQFRDLKIENEGAFARYLGITQRLGKKIDFEFENDNNRDMSNTSLRILTPMGDVIDSDTGFDDGVKFESPDREEDIDPTEFKALVEAVEKFSDLIFMAQKHLTSNYESQFTDETLEEEARDADYDFDEDGAIV